MDRYIVGALVVLAVWAGVTFTTDAPGWIHLLLTGGMFALIWRIVLRGTPGVTRTTNRDQALSDSTRTTDSKATARTRRS